MMLFDVFKKDYVNNFLRHSRNINKMINSYENHF